MIEVWIPENDLDYYYANGFPSKYLMQEERGYIKLNITLNELQSWKTRIPKTKIQEKNYGNRQILND